MWISESSTRSPCHINGHWKLRTWHVGMSYLYTWEWSQWYMLWCLCNLVMISQWTFYKLCWGWGGNLFSTLEVCDCKSLRCHLSEFLSSFFMSAGLLKLMRKYPGYPWMIFLFPSGKSGDTSTHRRCGSWWSSSNYSAGSMAPWEWLGGIWG